MKHARDKHKKNNSVSPRRIESAESARGQYTFSDTSRLHKDDAEKPNTIRTQNSKKNSSVKSKRKHSLFWAKFRTALLICICVGAVVGLGVGAGMYAAISDEIDEMDFDGIAYNFSSTIYANDKNGNSYEATYLHSDGNREWIDSDKIPKVLKEAAVSIEDERFYKHRGVDLKRTTGAVIGWFGAKITGKSPSYGGSTITQQVVKNITNEKDKTVTRKIKEIMRAIEFEKRFTKDEILTMYLNIAYFGNQCYGVEPAAKVYFSKNALDLTLPQAAMIVGITQAPSRYDPFKNPEDAKAKRNTVLKKMYDLGKISQEEYESASNTNLGVNTKYKSIHSAVYSYFVDQVINDVISDLQTKKGYSEQFASQQVFSGGLKIYTTMDESVQEAIESVYNDTSNFPAASKGTQSSMVIIDPKTGEIKGMAGGVGTKTESRGLNRATQSKRQPGSSIKPISVYAPALETGKITASTILTDEAVTIGDWSPKNSYSGFKGDLSLRKAIVVSANIPAVKALQTLGLETSYNYMKNKMHFSSIVDTDKNLSSLALGGLTKGVSAKEMAAAYGVFANKGVYITPHTYTKVLDSSGRVLLEYEPEETHVISEANAFIMSGFLKDVVNDSAGTGRRARLNGMTTYGKTGTSNDNCDKWFVGYTPYYVGAVWYGLDQMTPLNKVGVTTNVSADVWRKVMQKIHTGLESTEIDAPDNVTAVSICQKTGKLSSAGCGYAHTEYFVKGTVPSKYCKSSHSGVKGSTSDSNDTKKTNTATTPSPAPNATPGPASTEKPSESTPTPPPRTAPPSGNTPSATDKPSGGDIITLD